MAALAAKCDVLVENFVPGKLDAKGLGYEALSSQHKGLIYCSITGYADGPNFKKPGYDVIIEVFFYDGFLEEWILTFTREMLIGRSWLDEHHRRRGWKAMQGRSCSH